MGKQIREILKKSIRSRIDFSSSTAALLSAGMDSSVVTSVAAQYLNETAGKHAPLKTFSIGVKESPDIHNARIMASHLGTDHEELIVGINEMVDCLEQVIYYLESFDPSLVLSSVSNYLISRYARENYPLIRSKEELHYFRLFSGRFGTGKAIDTVGQWNFL